MDPDRMDRVATEVRRPRTARGDDVDERGTPSGATPSGATGPGTEDLLAERYGRTRPPAADRRLVILAAAVTALLGLVVVGWWAIGQANIPVRTQDVGFSIIDATAIDVTFDVTKDPASHVTCRVRALSPSFAEVGVRDVPIGPAAEATLRVTVRVATTERATTGMVQHCDVDPAP